MSEDLSLPCRTTNLLNKVSYKIILLHSVEKKSSLYFSLSTQGLDGKHGTHPNQCIPLYSMLLACGNPTVNFFRLLNINN